jgi:phosphoglycolate phosphatase-like HAD superfamily hydrolase
MFEDIQAVVFDLDGTLLDRRRSFEHFMREQWRRAGRVGDPRRCHGPGHPVSYANSRAMTHRT